jgi:hypothetical protein
MREAMPPEKYSCENLRTFRKRRAEKRCCPEEYPRAICNITRWLSNPNQEIVVPEMYANDHSSEG